MYENQTITCTCPNPCHAKSYRVSLSESAFSWVLDAHLVGEWTVEVEWAGDSGYESASTSVMVNVVEAVEEEPAGIPGFPIMSVLIGLLVLVGALSSNWPHPAPHYNPE